VVRPASSGPIAIRLRYLTLQSRRAWFRFRQRLWKCGRRSHASAADVPPTVAAHPDESFLKRAFRDRRASLFTGATLTGVLAVLLMLGWQVFQFLSDPSATRGAETRNRDDASPRNPAVAATSPRTAQHPDDPFGAATDGRTVPGGTKAVPHPRVKPDGPPAIGATKVDPPETADQTSTNRSPFDEPPAEPQFGKREFPTTAEDALPPAAKPSAKSLAGTIAAAGPPLGLEVVRTSVAPVPQPQPRFLATSAGTTTHSAADLLRLRTDDGAASAVDGWSATRHGRANPTIVRTHHGRMSSAGIAVTSTANARWVVAAPKLKLEILLPRRIVVGSRVPVRLRIVNVGTATAAAVTLHVDLPAELTYHPGRRLSLDVGELAPGAFHEARLTPVAERAGDASVSATAFCQEDRASGRLTRTITAAVGRPSKAVRRKTSNDECRMTNQ
jgi:hypothetical protein